MYAFLIRDILEGPFGPKSLSHLSKERRIVAGREAEAVDLCILRLGLDILEELLQLWDHSFFALGLAIGEEDHVELR